MHTDEAVNAYIVGQLLANGSYTYDPQDRHGPALALFALPMARVQGVKDFSGLTEAGLRMTPVLAGTLTILLLGAAARVFGFAPSLIAALLFAFAPLPLYYDRYFIHEPLFICATLGLMLAGWGAWAARSVWLAMVFGACAALMLACKETAFLHFLALAAAGLCFWLWNLRGKIPDSQGWLRVAAAAGASFLLLTVVFYSWFGSNWSALLALLHAGPSLFARAAGEGHQKPFWYFAQLLAGGWSGGAILALACIGFVVAFRRREHSPQGFLAFYALFLAAIYSLIPYKTPWLALNLWLPIALFVGLAMESIWGIPARQNALRAAIRACCILAVTGGAALIGHDTYQRVFANPAGENNPYAYAHTSEDLLGLPAEIEELARQDSIASPRIAVIAADPWPLPWYLRRFPQVGFWQPGQQAAKADFYITSSEAAEHYGDQLKSLHPDFFGSRPGVLVELWSPIPK